MGDNGCGVSLCGRTRWDPCGDPFSLLRFLRKGRRGRGCNRSLETKVHQIYNPKPVSKPTLCPSTDFLLNFGNSTYDKHRETCNVPRFH